MARSAKDLTLRPVSGAVAGRFIVRHHYLRTYGPWPLVPLGIFDGRALVGAMTFASPSIHGHRILDGAGRGAVLDLARLVLIDDTPRNSESRMISVAVREIARRYPRVELIRTFADACDCGDGTVYRAAGFLLTDIVENRTTYENADGVKIVDRSIGGRGYSHADVAAAGFEPVPGFRLRYVRPLRPGVRERLNCEILPYSAITEAGAGMYLGEPRRPKHRDDAPGDPAGRGQFESDPAAPLSEAAA